MKTWKEKVIGEIIRMGKKDSRLKLPAIALAAVFLVCYHAVRDFCLQFRFHPVRQRLLVGILIVSLLAGRIELLHFFAQADHVQAAENAVVSGFAKLPEEVCEQTVSVGTGLEELTLPDTLEASLIVPDGEPEQEETGSDDTETEEASDEATETDDAEAEEASGEERETDDAEAEEESDEVTETTDEQTEESTSDESAEDNTQTTESANTGGHETQNTEETALTESSEKAESAEDDGESLHSETYTVTMEEYYAENVITVETLTADNAQAETVIITGVTWTSEPEYDGNTEGTYIFTAVLPEGYALMEDVSLPQITVTVQENGEETEETLAYSMAVMTVTTTVASGTCGSNLTWTLDSDGTLTISGSGAMTDYAASAAPWYDYKDDIKTAIIENGVTSIGVYAFCACSALESIAISSGITSIEANAFFNCSSLKNIELPESVTSIGNAAFQGCSSLTSIEIPSGVTSIGSWVFYNCSSLESIGIPSGVTSIGDYAFRGCSSLTSIEIPSGVTSIGNYVFYGCSALGSIEIPESVTSIGNQAFYNCSALESIEIPENVTSIGNYAFRGCSSLESIEIPSGVTSIGSSTFYGCSALKSIDIPSGVTSIGDSAFYNCSSLESIDIPSGVTSIENSAFYNCKLLESIEIPSGVTSIGNSAFYGCRALESIDIPSGVTSIGSSAFYGCIALESIKISSGVTSIGNAAFFNCSALALVIMEGTSPATLGTSVFTSCKFVTDSRKDLVVPAGTRDSYIGAANWSSWAAYIHEDHDDGESMTAWTDSTSLPGATGSYYLAADVTLDAAWSVPSGTTKLCLNGHTITFESGYIEIGSGNALYICDCDEQERGSLSISNGGAYAVDNYGILGLSGSPTLTGTTADIHLRSGAYITVTDTLTGKFSIATADTPAVDAPVIFTNSTTTDYNSTNNFTSADASYKLQKNSSGQLELAVISYTVTLNGNGGSGTTLTSYTCGTGAVLPTDWTKTGYTFAGWYDNEGCTGTEVTEISTTETEDKEYWAKWVDDIAPVIGDLSYSYQLKNLWHWLIGKDSLMITVPVTEEGSGAEEITYTIITGTQEGSTAEQKTAVIKNGTATITLSTDFQGTITITCTDKDGNTSASVTAGATLDADGKGFIIEDNAPEITFAANNGASISSEYYNTAPDITVTVTDDADNAISAGIASITYQIGNGEEIPVNKDFAAQMVAECEFSITAGDIPTGETKITVTATDNAGNETSETITVKVKSPESKPAAAINYQTEMLTGLEPNADYTINDIVYQADADGCIAIDDNWIGTTIELVQKGNGTETTDSEAQEISIPARTAQTPSPGAEDESGLDAGDGKLTGLEAGTVYQISTDNGATWTNVTADANGEITGLAPGSYIVRIGSTDTDFASKPSTPVTIAAYLVTYTVTLHGNGGSGTALTSYTYGEGAVLPTDWTKTGYTFAGWYDNEDCTGILVIAISATDTGDKEYWAKWNKKSSDSSDKGSDDSTDHSDHETGGSDNNTDNADHDTGGSDNNTDNSDNNTDNFDNTGDSDIKAQPETLIVPDHQPDDSKEPLDESRNDADSTRQEDAETSKRTEPSEDADTTNRIPEGKTVQTVPVETEDDRLGLTGESVETENLTDISKSTTVLTLGDGAVIVTVNCEDDHYTAGVKDTVAVANIVLTPEQLQPVYDGGIIEIRIDVTDISQTVGEQDKEVIEQGLEAWRQEIPELTLGMYVDISMFIRVGESNWDTITSTDEPIEIVIGIPEDLQEDGREYYIIRSHEGAYALLNDTDSDADTITICTDSFSAYAIAYRTEEISPEAAEAVETAKCGLCHICPTLLGICCFIWLAVAIVLLVIFAWVIFHKRKSNGNYDKTETI